MNTVFLLASCATHAQESAYPLPPTIAEHTARAVDIDVKLREILLVVAARSPDDATAILASGVVDLPTDACGCLLGDPACSCTVESPLPVCDP